MEKKFTSDEVPLAQLLEEADSGKLQLPDFQRGWVWDDDHIASLLASVSVSYPIGAVMTLRTGNPDVRFKPRPLEGVELKYPTEPESLLLDGQQRMTSLYLALKSKRPVDTRDAKGKRLRRRYYADITTCIDPRADREDGIIGVPEDGIVRTFGGTVTVDVSTRQKEVASGLFPLDIVMDYSETMSWQLEYLNSGPGDPDTRITHWKQFNEAVITQFVQYQVPTIQLVRSTPKEAVCQVFEKVNTGGVSLTVFELLTATYAADDFNLRDDWADREKRFSEHRLLQRFEATDFLQVVTLLATRQRRLEHLVSDGSEDRAPAVSCKRRDILRLPLEDYQKFADIATQAVLDVVPFLHGEHIFDARDLPYPTQLVPLAAILATLGDGSGGHRTRKLIRRWFWCGVFGELYGYSTETRFAFDVQEVTNWVNDAGEEPRTVREAQFQADRLLTLRTRNSAAYKGLFALQMKRGARDFRNGSTIDVHAYIDNSVDIRQIFPKAWCSSHGIGAVGDSIVNKTAIDARTNRRIGTRSPSAYLASIETSERIGSRDLDEIVRSHDIDPIALRQDDFAAFFNHRFERLVKQIEEAMGKEVNRAQGRTESPFADPVKHQEQLIAGIRQLLTVDESKVVEYKSTGRRSTHTGRKDPNVEWSVVKTIAGFMNANGGSLLVGVNDDKEVVGIDQDYEFLQKQDRDGWELWLTQWVSSTLGKVAAADLSVAIAEVDGHDVARIDVGPAASPVFATPTRGEKVQRFYARINNSTQELTGRDLIEYQRKRWPE